MTDTPYYDAGQGVGALIAAALAHNHKQALLKQQLGTVLGLPGVAPSAPMPFSLSDMGGPYSNPTMTVAPPVTSRNGVMAAPTPPNAFPSAPEPLRPLMAQPVDNLAKLDAVLGKNSVMTKILTGMGVGGEGMQLEMGADGSFHLKGGPGPVSTKTASVLMRQEDLKQKKNVQDWHAAVEARLKRGQLSNDERIALSADRDLLGLLNSPNFDMMDDTIKTQLQSQATAAINRLQQRGVKVLTGSRAKAAGVDTPTAPPATKASVSTPTAKTPEQRFTEIKAANPTMTDQSIYAQMAIEEASK